MYVLHAAALDRRIARVLTHESPALLRLGQLALDGREQRLDLLLLAIRQLRPRREELDAVVRGRIVRRRYDRAGAFGKQRHRRRRQHAAEHDVRPARGEAAG